MPERISAVGLASCEGPYNQMPGVWEDLTPEERAGCAHANHKLALAITPYFFNLIDRNDPDCPIRKQVIPREGEMVISEGEMLDSLGEDEHSPVSGLVRKTQSPL